MSTALTILGAGVTWLILATLVGLLIGRIFALNEQRFDDEEPGATVLPFRGPRG